MRHEIERYRKLLRLAEIASKLVDRAIDDTAYGRRGDVQLDQTSEWKRWRKLVNALLAIEPSDIPS